MQLRWTAYPHRRFNIRLLSSLLAILKVVLLVSSSGRLHHLYSPWIILSWLTSSDVYYPLCVPLIILSGLTSGNWTIFLPRGLSVSTWKTCVIHGFCTDCVQIYLYYVRLLWGMRKPRGKNMPSFPSERIAGVWIFITRRCSLHQVKRFRLVINPLSFG